MLENQIEKSFVKKLADELKYVYRDDIHDRQGLERNFREKFQALNRCHLTDKEFARLLEEIKENDYNLNITRYVNLSKEEEPVDLEAVAKQLKETEAKIEDSRSKLNLFLKELGLEEI